MNDLLVIGGAIVMAASVGAILWKLMSVTVEAGKAYPVLIELAEQFAPNEGTTLRDVIDRLEQSAIEARNDRNELRDHIEQIANTVDVFIVDRRPGGKRRSDPPPED